MSQPVLRVIPLGGLGEIGKNMMAIEYDGAAIVIDTGLMFPESDMLGIDYIIPDFNYLLQPGIEVKAIIVTHGHEDHTGAIAHVLGAIRAPVYATPLTCGLLELKLRGARMGDRGLLNRFRAGDILDIPPFKVETFHVCHSIPDCVGVGIQTPLGLIVHTGDFKLDQTPVDNWPTDYARLASFSERSPLLLLSDSTNADRAGWTPSERVIDGAFDKVFREAKGRIIVATFASLISRIQQVANAAQRYGRKMAVMGHSMTDNIRMASNLGYLELPPDLLVNMDEAVRLPPEQIVFMATGTQGEPTAVLNRLAGGRHKNLELQRGDTIVMSAHPIPGNEEAVYRIINRLLQRGANVIYDPIAPVHVSGHASQEEQKLMLSLVKPRYFIPIHGELRHLQMHARLAEQVGIPHENIAIIENGVVVEFDETGKMTVGSRYPGGYVFVDGATVGDITLELLREREHLSRDGIVMVSVAVRTDRTLCAPPQIVSRGFVLQRDTETFVFQVNEAITRSLENAAENNPETPLEDLLRGDIERAIHVATRRRPQVFVSVLQI